MRSDMIRQHAIALAYKEDRPMNSLKRSLVRVGLAAVFLIFTLSQIGVAQDQEASVPQGDPPGRVARLDYSSGSVSFQPGGEGDWVEAVNNRPLTAGDNLWADQNSRVELQIGSMSLRMSSETSVTFLDLDDHTTQIKLSQGTLEFRVRHLDDGDTFEIDTPNLAFGVQRTGEYRIDVNANGDQTVATVWSGRGEVTGGGSSYSVIAGQQATFSGTEQLDHEIAQLPGRDDFDNWVLSRDQREDRAESANYISTEMTGYEDLDDSGHWHYVADYGPVWTPSGVVPDWAPYRYGHWAWVGPWGWTWVEDEPWGFAPFHYGRWAFVESAWCWVPGPVVVRPYYAPALVAFVGGGGFGLSVGAAGGGVGWFALGPREVYVPWYRTSREYVNTVNITNTHVNVTQVTNIYNAYNSHTNNVTQVSYMNQHVANGVTVVSHDTFVNARPVARSMVHVDERQLASAPLSRQIDAQPVRASVMGPGRPVSARPPAAVENRRVVATRNPTPPLGSLEQRQAQVRPLTPDAAQSAAPASGRLAPSESGRNVPRPPNEADRQPNENARAFQTTHPLVRTAPPVQERPEQQRNEQQKFNSWQQQRQRPTPQPQHEERAPQSRGGDKPRH
jgi:hypothetical protein